VDLWPSPLPVGAAANGSWDDSRRTHARSPKMALKKYSREFKVAAVKLVKEQGYSPQEAAASLGVSVPTLKAWVEKFSSQVGKVIESEPARLRAQLKEAQDQIKRVTMERDILKKATVFFAKQQD
jgi:transposase